MKVEMLQEFRDLLVKQTDCDIQDGWPCGTCIMTWLDDLGLDSKLDFYSSHNESIVRHNEVWRFILQVREGDPDYQDSSNE